MAQASNVPPLPQHPPLGSLREAFDKFAAAIRPSDDRLFRDTTLEDVRKSMLIIERDQHKQRRLRNLRRLEPLLDAFRKLGIAIEPLCQGIPYLCYIWAPLKLLLHIADEYTKGFELLVDAYAQIAQHLPRFDRLHAAFDDQSDFVAVLADVYSDILEFHTYAYKFLCRSSWKHLFDATWKNFGTRFNAILQRLDRGRELIDREATSFDILQSKAFRQSLLSEVERQETFRRNWQLRDFVTWLDLRGQDREQDDLLERRAVTREPQTCTWILNHPKIMTWLDQDDPRPYLWLRGKPGSGKTTLVTYLIQEAPFPPKAPILYCLCSYGFGRSDTNACSLALRAILAQVVAKRPDVLDHVYENYVRTAMTPALSKLRQVLKEVLGAIGTTFIIVDGLDECDPVHQRQILTELTQLVETDDRSLKLKILVASRESPDIKRKLAAKPSISLSDETQHTSKDIARFTQSAMQDLHSRFDNSLVNDLATEIVRRADGMFLWVHLVIGSLVEQESEQDLQRALNRLPTKLPDVYQTILTRLDSETDDFKRRKVDIILALLAFAIRPMKTWEVCDFITLHRAGASINEQTKLRVEILDICKPLVEERDNQTIGLVHFSAREFLLHKYSGPRIVEKRAHKDITAACIRYLLTINKFHPQVTGLVHGEVVKGFHDVFPYIYENWLTHLTKYLGLLTSDSDDPAMMGMLWRLSDYLKQVQSGNAGLGTISRDIHQPTTVDMNSGPLAMPLSISLSIGYRERLAENQRVINNGGAEQMDDDPTLLSDVYARYRIAFENLLEGKSPYTNIDMKISEKDLQNFRERHKGSFLCRWPGCRVGWMGFSSVSERDKHETSHKLTYHCPELSCAGLDSTFNTKSALRKHMDRFHLKDDELPEFPLSKDDSGNYRIDHGGDHHQYPEGKLHTTRDPNHNWFREKPPVRNQQEDGDGSLTQDTHQQASTLEMSEPNVLPGSSLQHGFTSSIEQSRNLPRVEIYEIPVKNPAGLSTSEDVRAYTTACLFEEVIVTSPEIEYRVNLWKTFPSGSRVQLHEVAYGAFARVLTIKDEAYLVVYTYASSGLSQLVSDFDIIRSVLIRPARNFGPLPRFGIQFTDHFGDVLEMTWVWTENRKPLLERIRESMAVVSSQRAEKPLNTHGSEDATVDEQQSVSRDRQRAVKASSIKSPQEDGKSTVYKPSDEALMLIRQSKTRHRVAQIKTANTGKYLSGITSKEQSRPESQAKTEAEAEAEAWAAFDAASA